MAKLSYTYPTFILAIESIIAPCRAKSDKSDDRGDQSEPTKRSLTVPVFVVTVG